MALLAPPGGDRRGSSRYGILNWHRGERPLARRHSARFEMSDRPLNKGPHDRGGEAAGPIDTTDHGMRFWEKQANALRSTLTRKNIVRLDALRRAAEDLGEEYYKLAYFERTTTALRNILLENGLFTEAELRAKMAEVRARFDVPPESESPIKKGVNR
jgi:hypothetical protein